MNSQQNFAVFLTGTDSENKIIEILRRKEQKIIWTKLSSLEQEPTFKKELIYGHRTWYEMYEVFLQGYFVVVRLTLQKKRGNYPKVLKYWDT